MPLVLDLANPSPGLGWGGEERRTLEERSNADVVLALALVHHLAIGRNVPLERIAGYFARLAPGLVIEFVPKEDPMVRKLLATREDVFADYTLDGFRTAFGTLFDIAEEAPVTGTARGALPDVSARLTPAMSDGGARAASTTVADRRLRARLSRGDRRAHLGRNRRSIRRRCCGRSSSRSLVALLLAATLTALSRSRDLGALAATAVALWLIAAVSYPVDRHRPGTRDRLLVAIGLCQARRAVADR